VAIIALRIQVGSFSIPDMMLAGHTFTPGFQYWVFLAFFISFAIKVPMFPFHTWLPDAHVEAPTAGSVILAGVLLKMGTYGFLRYCIPLFPQATVAFVPLISILAVIGIIYGALVAMVQPNMKKLVAYSSVSHLGFVMLGLFALNQQGMQGGILQMINHGISTGALFFLVGMLYDRRHTFNIGDFGGIAKIIPVYTTVFIIAALSSLGLPGLNGFVGEFLILLGAWRAHPIYAIFAASGVILAAVYLLWMIQRVFYGPVDKEENKKLPDMTLREKFVLYPLILVIVLMGVYPQIFLSKMETSVRVFLENMPK
jgi:NADH-quinone oxidoreductase subunit M